MQEEDVARLSRAAAQAKLGLWEYDPDTGLFRGSDIVFEVLGLPGKTAADLKTVSAFFLSDGPALFERAIELACRESKPFTLVSEVQAPSGERKWLRVQGQVTDEGLAPRQVFGTMQDISEIRLLDRVTQESEMTLNRVEEITHIGHWSVSLADGALYHSDEIKRIFGYEPSAYALSVEDAINAYHPDDREEVLRLFKRAVQTGEGYEFDLRVVQPSGDVRHVHSKGYTELDGEGKIARVYGVFQDITERVLAEKALRESEASMKALIDVIHTAIVVHDKSGSVVLSNPMADRLLAPLTPEVTGRELADPAWQFIGEDGHDLTVDELPASRIIRTAAPLENLVIGRRVEGKVGWLLVSGAPVRSKDGQLTKVIMSFVDITERRDMEAQIHQSDKMKAIGQLAGGVAHDFNNQLMVMLTFAEFLKESLPEGSEELSWVKGIESSATHSAQLTKQLLAFARKGQYVVTTVDLNGLILDVTSMASHSFNKNIRVQCRLRARPATVAGDASQLQNALLNLALNSRDAMPHGGELVFTTERVSLDGLDAALPGLDRIQGECVRITISDTGAGMDAATLEHVFEPFFTTKEPGRGTGMGLASVYGTVKTHHGAIQIESEPDRGTTITIHLPFTLGTRNGQRAATKGQSEAGGRLLIIDDEPAVASSMSALLRRRGYAATTFLRATEALEHFQKFWREIDLVLLDMVMPEMGGKETFFALRAINPAVKVILISGYSFSDQAKELLEAGAPVFLVKPVAAAELLQVLADALSG